MAEIRNSRIAITGASSGIGKAIALEAASKGAELAITARRSDRLKKAAHEIVTTYPDMQIPLVVPCDVTDREDVRRFIQSARDHMGGIDILVNNAGIGLYGNAEKTTLEDFRTVMDVNFFGAVNCIFEALPIMKSAGRGLIVNIASVAAIHGVPYLGAYCASKSALVALSQSLRAELSDSNISVMVIYPGYTESDLFKYEKNVGGARRPDGTYASAEKVARSIVRAIERERREAVLTLEGKALATSKVVLPWAVERAMEHIAGTLQVQERDQNE